MSRKTLYLVLITLCTSITASDGLIAKTTATDDADIRSFDELIGTWQCAGVSRNMDGTWKTDSTHSTWVWFHLFQGNGVQDIFYGGLDPEQVDTASRGGTNIRIYNPDDKKWYMAWFDTNNRKIATFLAVGDKDKIIMEGINSKGRSIRNVFSNISNTHFTWTQYWTFDGGNTWLDVSVLQCRKYKQD